MNAQELSEAMYCAFAIFAKPEHSTNYSHCEECAEYDLLLRSVARTELTVAQIGTVAWGAIPFLTPQALAYYFPRLAELALRGERNVEGDSFVCQFLNQVLSQGKGSPQLSCLGSEHRLLVLRCMDFIADVHLEEIEAQCYADVLQESILAWSM
ncbi:hypothetical protein [Dokdonella ginsengisoli]|uniref:Uncharacterized protein n=1 Tax=Dokdonella ginsengisoli TaxID=363846 RepID=A0ABV9QU39_9GAMM